MSTQRTITGGIIGEFTIETPGTVRPPPPLSDISKTFIKYDSLTDSWVSLKDMNSSRAGHCQIDSLDYIFAIGGTNGIQTLSSIEKYNSINNTWTTMEPMNVSRSFFNAELYNDEIYVIGGLRITSSGQVVLTDSFEKYNIQNDEWTVLDSVPENVSMGNSFVYNGNIYVISGYKDQLYTLNDSIFIYNISLGTWSTYTITDESEKLLVYRALSFGFLKDNIFFSSQGIYYTETTTISEEITTTVDSQGIRNDAFSLDLSDNSIIKSENNFSVLPKSRYAGSALKSDYGAYFLGGVNSNNNTLKYFEEIGFSSTPWNYQRLANLPKGRSYFASSLFSDSYSELIYVTGGLLSRIGENYYRVDLDSYPSSVYLNGKNSANVNISVYDENGDAPEELTLRIKGVLQGSGLINEDETKTNENLILFTKDNISVKNGKGVATVLPRAEDNSAVLMSDSYTNSYNATISGFILDSVYSGETAPSINITDSGEIGTSQEIPENSIPIPSEYTIDRWYTSISSIDQLTQGGYAILTNITPFISLLPKFLAGGNSSSIEFIANQSWMPITKSIIEDSAGSFETIREELNKLEYLPPFGGSPLFDALFKADDIIDNNTSTLNQIIYSITDGENNCSNYTVDDVILRNNNVSGSKEIPMMFSGLKIYPTTMHIGSGDNANKEDLLNITNESNGSLLYILSDSDINEHVLELLKSRGFVGYGFFWFTLDLGDIYELETITVNFDLTDPRTIAYFKYQTSKDSNIYNSISETLNVNETISVSGFTGRYIKFYVDFFADINANEYYEDAIVPPKMTSVVVNYNKPTCSTIIFNPDVIEDNLHQVVVTLNNIKNDYSEINIGADTEEHNDFEDYETLAKPNLINSSKVLIPIRQLLSDNEEYTLEQLTSRNGVVWECQYGPWATNSTYNVYTLNETTNTFDLVDSSLYKAFPNKGYIVFNTKTTNKYSIAIINQKSLNVAAQVINRKYNSPVVISGAGYMYSTLAKKQFTKISDSIPEAFNLLIYPLNPTITSTFKASYNYYDLNGRLEKGTVIKWYINNVEEPDLQNILTWSNPKYEIVESGDTVYFSVIPKNEEKSGLIKYSIPVKVL